MENKELFAKIKKLLKKARNAQEKADEASCDVYQFLDELGIDLDAASRAENADCLNDAISCYIQYGEFGCKNLITEIMSQFVKEA